MIITQKQLIALLPLLIVGLTIVIIILSIEWRRNHFLNATISLIGLNAALISLWFIDKSEKIDVTPLICIDNYAILYTALLLLASLATCIFAYPWLEGYNNNKEEFYLLVLIASLGGILLASTKHLVSLFLGIALISIPLFGLIGYVFPQKHALEASIKYMILSIAASSFLLFGIALLYAQTGNLSFIELSKSFNSDMLHEPLLLVGLGMMIVGLGFKLSLVPFHLWTPDVYQGTPAPVCIFLATGSKIAIFGVVMRLFLYIPVGNSEAIHVVLSIIAFLSIIFGNLMALSQTNIKRLLGYSSIAHMGYLLITLIALQNGEISMETVNIYIIGYLLSIFGAFGVISLMSSPYCGQDIDSLFSYRGLFWRCPILSTVMTIMMLSLAGIPMTLGFISKFFVLAVSVETHLWWLTISMIIGSVISLCYYLHVTLNLYLSAPKQLDRNIPHNWQYSVSGVMILLSVLLILIFGIYPQPLIYVVRHAIPIL